MSDTLEELVNDIGAEAFLIIDLEGNVIKSENVDFAENIGLMTEAAFSMCKDLSQDLGKGDLEQLITKTSKGLMITSRVEDKIISILSNDFSKLGLFLKKMSFI